MGRKSQSKQVNKKNAGKENSKFSLQKRKELGILADKLLKLTSTFHGSPNVNKTWEHHLKIDTVLKEIKAIEAVLVKNEMKPRQHGVENYLKWLIDNGANFDGVVISEFEGYEMGLKATKEFKEGALVLTVPSKIMMTERDAQKSELAPFIAVDPLLQNMPNIMLALFLLLEKFNPESFWKPYIEMLPEKYSTVLYFTDAELSELRPSPVFESSLKLCKSIARQYAYFYNKIHSLDVPVLKKLEEIFTYENYRWAVSTVMTRQNNIQLEDSDVTAFIPLWDMCNHEHGKITTDFNKEQQQGECYALRDFKCGEQIFIFYGYRPNSDLFLHNGFVYPKNQHDSYSLALGISSADPHKDIRNSLLTKLGLSGVTHFNLYKADVPISAEMLAFVRIFNMDKDELTKWLTSGLPADLVSSDATNSQNVGSTIDRKAYTYLKTRCQLVKRGYKEGAEGEEIENVHRQNVKLLKKCEVQILDSAIKYLDDMLQNLPTIEAK